MVAVRILFASLKQPHTPMDKKLKSVMLLKLSNYNTCSIDSHGVIVVIRQKSYCFPPMEK